MKILLKLMFFVIFVIVLAIVIGYARGYRFDIEKKSLKSTGIISLTSSPKAAKIFVNGELKGVTDTNLTLPPENYFVEIKKEGYTSWSKQINLKGELVINIDPVLFPVNPSLSPLTNLGVIKAFPTDDGDKIFIIASGSAYLFDAGKKTLPFFPPLNKIVDLSLLPNISGYTNVKVSFSPNQKEVILESEKNSYLLSLEENNLSPLDVTTSKESLLQAWKIEKDKNNAKILETFPENFDKIASASFEIISFSPNETKVLYRAKESAKLPLMINPPLISTNQTPEERNVIKNKIYVYDRKEDKNFPLLFPIPQPLASNIKWYSDSRHLVVEEVNKISIVDYDNTNKQTIYSGPFESSFFNPTSDGKIIVLINLNSQVNKLPDLYLVGIR
jgi:hypothetical protein